MSSAPGNLEHVLLAMAGEEARRYGCHYIGAEHFLLALIRFAKDDPLLFVFGLNEITIRRRLDRIGGHGIPVAEVDLFRQTPSLKESLHRAWVCARRAKKRSMDVDDFLVGVASVESVASILLERFGVSERLISSVRQELTAGVSAGKLRAKLQSPDPLAFALPYANDPFIAGEIYAICAAEQEKWDLVEAAQFEEAVRLRDRLIEQMKALREYCSQKVVDGGS